MVLVVKKPIKFMESWFDYDSQLLLSNFNRIDFSIYLNGYSYPITLICIKSLTFGE